MIPCRTVSSAVIWLTLTTFPPLAQAGPADGGGKMLIDPPLADPWGGPLLGGGIKSNDVFTEGSLFMVYPLLEDIGTGGDMGGSVFFVEPYGTWAENGELGASLGLGFRKLFSDQSVADALSGAGTRGWLSEGVFLGANAFLDYGESAFGNDFWQGGIGLEAGTRYLEFRANYYLPITDDRTLGRHTETSVSRHSTESRRTVYGPATVSGDQIVRGATRQTTTTTRTTTTRTTYETFEEALEGWDMEVALLVPGLDEYCDLRLVGGYYQFSGDRSRVDIEGWRAGVELRPIPAMVLHATWYESEHLYQDNWLAGVRVELPLEGIRDAFRMRRRHLAERLFEPVRRKNSAITTSGLQSAVVGTSSSSSTSQSTQNHPAGSQVIGSVPPPPPIEEEEEEDESEYFGERPPQNPQ